MDQVFDMCSLCGILGGGEHWTDGQAVGGPATRRADRQRRVGLANAILAYYGLQMSDWVGAQYMLSSRTGRSEIVDDPTHLWQMAERLLGRKCDPLDPALIDRLEREA
jgi:hypothetical protein